MKSGTIFFGDTTVACLVLNMSTGGASLVMDGDVAIPFAFDLDIEGDAIQRRRCLVVWRIERRFGVSFDLHRMALAERTAREVRT